MKALKTSTGRTAGVALRMILLSILILGLLYTLAVTGLAQLLFPRQAAGSLVYDEEGTVIGSSLIGQAYQDEDGNPLPQYFQSRPSAAGEGYDGFASGGSNLGTNDAKLKSLIELRQENIVALDGVKVSEIPADAVTASGSGLDPHISPEYAYLQAERIAESRNMTVEEIDSIIDEETGGPILGYLGQSRVNVVELNWRLDQSGN